MKAALLERREGIQSSRSVVSVKNSWKLPKQCVFWEIGQTAKAKAVTDKWGERERMPVVLGLRDFVNQAARRPGNRKHKGLGLVVLKLKYVNESAGHLGKT